MCNQRGLVGVRLDRDIYRSMIDPPEIEKKENLVSGISDLQFRRSRIQIFGGDTKKIETAISELIGLRNEAEKRARKAERIIEYPAEYAPRQRKLKGH